jgi:hypothetical protein
VQAVGVGVVAVGEVDEGLPDVPEERQVEVRREARQVDLDLRAGDDVEPVPPRRTGGVDVARGTADADRFAGERHLERPGPRVVVGPDDDAGRHRGLAVEPAGDEVPFGNRADGAGYEPLAVGAEGDGERADRRRRWAAEGPFRARV